MNDQKHKHALEQSVMIQSNVVVDVQRFSSNTGPKVDKRIH